MKEMFQFIIAIVILILGVPIGNILAKNTKEELKDGKIWFLILIFICLIGVILGLIFKNDILLFTFLFIAVVTSRSLKIKEDKKKRR